MQEVWRVMSAGKNKVQLRPLDIQPALQNRAEGLEEWSDTNVYSTRGEKNIDRRFRIVERPMKPS